MSAIGPRDTAGARVRAHIRSNVVGYVAVFIAMSGTAYAVDGPLAGQNQVGSEDIINGEVKEHDIGQAAVTNDEVKNDSLFGADVAANTLTTTDVKNETLNSSDVAPNSLSSGRIADASLTGVDVKDNALKGADIDEATLDVGDGARAYALVKPFNCDTGLFAACTPDLSKGISSVIRELDGTFCVTAPGISALATPAAVTVDFTSSTDGAAASAMAMSESCGTGGKSFRVRTERLPEISVDAGGGVNNATAYGANPESTSDVGFTILIP
jgi:hypothetical protein